ncbi:tRNA methyltransferase PPM2, partial [Ascoidea rubescens DSM 1968]
MKLEDELLSIQKTQKIQKRQEKQKFLDLLIQGTNNSSIVSKRSVERLYSSNKRSTKNDYFRYFVKKPQRRSPIINRGYLLRMLAIKNSILSIIDSSIKNNLNNNHDLKFIIINLGCGFDPLPFELINNNNLLNNTDKNDLLFIDIDYKDLIERKVSIIKNSVDLLNIIKNNNDNNNDNDNILINPNILLQSNSYLSVASDLNDSISYKNTLSSIFNQLNALNINQNKKFINIFLSEVAIAYMDPIQSDKIIKVSINFNNNIYNNHFLLLEQILPSGFNHPFAKKMLNHFNNLGSPINSISDISNGYHNLNDQVNRFLHLYNTINNNRKFNIEINDLLNYYNQILDKNIKLKINQIEPFDEWEEFYLFAQHYFILHFNNDQINIFNDNFNYQKVIENSLSSNLLNNKSFSNLNLFIQKSNSNNLQRKFMSSCKISNQIFLNSGFQSTRLNNSMLLSTNLTKSTRDTDLIILKNPNDKGLFPIERMCHSITNIDNNNLILTGGRTSPNNYLDDCWLLTKDKNSLFNWKKLKSIPNSRFRHSTFLINKNTLILFGGNFSSNNSLFLRYNISEDEWQEMDFNINIENIISSCLHYNENSKTGYIIGGMNSNNRIESSFYSFKVDLNKNKIELRNLGEDRLFNRYGGQLILRKSFGNNKNANDKETLLLIGGVSDCYLLDQYNSIIEIEIEIETGNQVKINFIKIDEKIWNKMPLLIGFNLLEFNERYKVCLLGGGVCFSFGSIWNDILIID